MFEKVCSPVRSRIGEARSSRARRLGGVRGGHESPWAQQRAKNATGGLFQHPRRTDPMPVISRHISVNMRGDTQIENITPIVQNTLSDSEVQAGTVTVFVKHTTASVMIIEDEPGIRSDTKQIWEQLIPASSSWKHNTQNPGEDNGHSHLRGQMQGPSITIPFIDQTLALGTWQQIVVIDFDTRPRTREIILQLIGE